MGRRDGGDGDVDRDRSDRDSGVRSSERGVPMTPIAKWERLNDDVMMDAKIGGLEDRMIFAASLRHWSFEQLADQRVRCEATTRDNDLVPYLKRAIAIRYAGGNER